MALITLLKPRDRAEYAAFKDVLQNAGVKAFDEFGVPLEELPTSLGVPMAIKVHDTDVARLANALADSIDILLNAGLEEQGDDDDKDGGTAN